MESDPSGTTQLIDDRYIDDPLADTLAPVEEIAVVDDISVEDEGLTLFELVLKVAQTILLFGAAGLLIPIAIASIIQFIAWILP